MTAPAAPRPSAPRPDPRSRSRTSRRRTTTRRPGRPRDRTPTLDAAAVGDRRRSRGVRQARPAGVAAARSRGVRGRAAAATPSRSSSPRRRTACQDLLPLRHGRMASSAFAFYRGAPAVMAFDLSTTPTSQITVQASGDAHLSNFGLFASPERTLVFDSNDFDETLPGPWEWDVKRLAASVVIASRATASRRGRPARRSWPRSPPIASRWPAIRGCACSRSGTTGRRPRTSRPS